MNTGNTTTTELNCDEIEELLPLLVLGLLDGEELAGVETHLPLCPACSAAMVQYEAVTGVIPLSLDPIAPEPSSRAQLLARLDPPATVAPAPAPDSAPANVTSITEQRSSRSKSWRSFAAAAVLLLTLGGGAFWINELTQDRDEARDTLAMVQDFVSPNALTMPLEPMPTSQYEWGWGASRLLKNPDGEMMLVVEGCPPTTDDRSYPVWIAVGDHRTLLGEITIHEDGTGWMMMSMPDDMPEPEILGVSVIEGDEPLVDLFLGDMAG
jgi:hypothetical protein